VQKKIGYQATIQVMQGLRAYFDPEYLNMMAIPKVIPAEMVEWFNSPEGKWLKKGRVISRSDLQSCYDQ
jgi:hypothetical protein